MAWRSGAGEQGRAAGLSRGRLATAALPGAAHAPSHFRVRFERFQGLAAPFPSWWARVSLFPLRAKVDAP